MPGDLCGNSDCKLIFVHERGFKPSAEDYMDLAVTAMSAGIERDHPALADRYHSLEKELAYYGDITGEFLAGRGETYDVILDIGDRRNALVKLRAIDKKKNFGVARYDRLPGKTAIGEFAADVMAPLLGGLGFSKKLIAKVGIDLCEYWNSESDFADRLRERVRTAICAAMDAGRRIVLVSHGTGCVVAYDVLWQLSHEPAFAEAYRGRKVDLWLTLGAPLGDSMVRRRLLGAKQKGPARFPSNVVSWHNVSAEDDFVSHDNTLADDFRMMLKQKQVSCICDYRIYNLSVRYGRSNPHCPLGYLIHPRTAQILADWLQLSATAPLPTNIF